MPNNDTETREQKAYRKALASARTLAKQHGNPELADGIATANHQDPAVRGMRRMEAFALLLDGLVSDTNTDSKPATKAKATKSDSAKSSGESAAE